MTITALSEVLNREDVSRQIEEIFFEASSLKNFSSSERKAAFYKRWCKDYQTVYPDEFFVMMEGDFVQGYLSGCRNSQDSLTKLEVPGPIIFADLFNEFPAHLHINFHSSLRGKGLGSKLVNAYIETLKESHCPGLHLITSPEAMNVSFYDRLGFSHQVVREFNGMKLLFMGKKLD